jgi:hypothetical protein
MFPNDTILGNINLGEIYPLSSSGSTTHTAVPLSDLWPCNLQAATRRDIDVEYTTIANQWIAIGEPTPVIEAGWMVKFYVRNFDDTPGELLGTFHVTDPDPYTVVGGRHHQEIHLMLVDVNS